MVRLTPKPFKRQDTGDPLAAPTVSGLGGATSMAGDPAATASSLAVDGSRDPSVPGAAQFSISLSAPTSAPTPASPDTPETTTPPSTVTPQSSSGSSISTTTVVGACVGAFAGAIFLICIGLWLYRRSSQALKARTRAPLTSISRNARGDIDRSRSHRGDPWNKLESGDQDKWEGMQTEQKHAEDDKGADSVGPMEKLTMFKNRSPSIRTAVTTKSVEDLPLPVFSGMHPYSNVPALPGSYGKQPPHLGSVDVGGAISWTSAEDGSFFTLRSDNFDINTARAISPSTNPARQTPQTTSASSLHRWESAEVVTHHDTNPFDDEEPEPRRSLHNPFFSAQDFDDAKARAQAKAARNKEKNSQSISNPFANPSITVNHPASTSSPLASKHTSDDSVSSQQSDNERAILSIIAALDNSTSPSLTPEPRVVSTLSTGTGYSVVDSYSAVSGEEDVTSAFPLPPHKPQS